MKLITTIVQEDIWGNKNRLDILDELFEICTKQSAKLLCLPGGYFSNLQSYNAIKEFSRGVIKKARKYNVAITFGIDLISTSTINSKNKDRTFRPLYHVVCWSPDKPRTMNIWKQRSSTPKNAKDVSSRAVNEDRTFKVNGKRIGVIACGEIYNDRIIRQTTQNNPVDALIVHSHGAGGGFNRIGRTIRRHQLTIPCFISVNANSHTTNYGFDSGGDKTNPMVSKSLEFIDMYTWKI
jgi:hypothetical protein